MSQRRCLENGEFWAAQNVAKYSHVFNVELPVRRTGLPEIWDKGRMSFKLHVPTRWIFTWQINIFWITSYTSGVLESRIFVTTIIYIGEEMYTRRCYTLTVSLPQSVLPRVHDLRSRVQLRKGQIRAQNQHHADACTSWEIKRWHNGDSYSNNDAKRELVIAACLRAEACRVGGVVCSAPVLAQTPRIHEMRVRVPRTKFR